MRMLGGEARTSGSGAPQRPKPDSGQRCPHCGEYEMHEVDHGPDWEAKGYGTREHLYCSNCDNGLCSGEC